MTEAGCPGANGEGLHAVRRTGSCFYMGNAIQHGPPSWAFVFSFGFGCFVVVFLPEKPEMHI